MAALRNFTPEVLEIMAKNIDTNADDYWDYFEDIARFFSVPDVFKDAWRIKEDLDGLNNYLNRYMELNDITHKELLQVLDAVKEVEDRYCKRFKETAAKFRAIRVNLKRRQTELDDMVKRIATLELLYGAGVDFDILDDPEQLARARYDALKRGLDFPLTAAQLQASEAAYQKLLFMEDVPDLCVDALQDARAKGATQVTELTSVADISQLLIDIENYNRRNPDNKIIPPALTEGQLGVVEGYRQEIAAIGDPLYAESSSYVSSLYGYRFAYDNDMHHGIDIAAPKGAPIISVWNGEVIENGYNSYYGNYTIIKTIIDGKEYNLVFMHMESPSALQEGDMVVPGSEIGGVGGTPNYPVHLHFEVREPGGDTYGWDRSTTPPSATSVNPSVALNGYYEHPEITNTPDVEDGQVYYYDPTWSYSDEVARINEARNEERWPDEDGKDEE